MNSLKTLRNSRGPLSGFMMAILAWSQISQPLQAAKYYWQIDSASDQSWQTTNGWRNASGASTGSLFPNAVGDYAYIGSFDEFDVSAPSLNQNLSINLVNDITLGTLAIGNPNGPSVTLKSTTGKKLILSNGSTAVIEHWGFGSSTVSADIQLNSDLYVNFFNGAGGTLTLGNITESGGSRAFTKDSVSGTLIINGTAGFTGKLTVDDGTLRFSGAGNVSVAGLSGGGNAVIENGNASAKTLTVGVASGSDLFQGIIKEGVGGGAFSLVKTGAGTLVLAGANTYTGTTTISAGTLQVGDGVLPGSALGTGNVINNGTLALNNASATWLFGTGTGARSMSGSGAVTLVAGTLNVNNLANFASATANTINLADGTTYNLTLDGDARGSIQTLSTGGDNIALTGTNGTVTINLNRTATTALNKTIQMGGLSLNSQTLVVNANNQYTLEFTGGTTLAGANPTFNIAGGARASNMGQSVVLGGVVSGAFGFTKIGNGVLVLGNANNTFGAVGGSNVQINAGFVQANGANALGNNLNTVTINTNSASQGLRFGGGTFAVPVSYSVAQTIILANGTSAIDVTAGTTATLATAFGLSAVGNALVKNDNGTLVIAAANSTWTGTLTINDGAVRVANASALGTTAGATTVANNTGAAVEIAGVATAENFTIANTGIDTAGALVGYSGTSTITGTITLSAAGMIGVNSGAILNLNGAGNGVTGTQNLTLGGAGTGNVNTLLGITTGTLTKMGAGTWNITTDNAYTGATTVNYGTLAFSGANGRAAASASFSVNQGGVLTLDNSTANPTVANRLGGKALTMSVGTLNFISNTAGSTESIGALVINIGASTINMTGTGSGTLNFTGLTINNTGGLLNINAAGLGSTNKVFFASGVTPVNGIVQRFTINGGTDFATYTANGVEAYTGYNTTNNLNAAVDTATLKVSANSFLGASRTLNAVAVSGNNLTLGGLGSGVLTLTTGAVLVNGGNNTIQLTSLAMGANTGIFQVAAGSTLNFQSLMTGSNGLVKALGGTMILGLKQSYSSTTNLDEGTLVLNAGINTLLQNQTMNVNQGSTLDLNGNVQWVATLNSVGTALPGAGGTIKGGAGSMLVTQNGSGVDGVFSGLITDSVSLVKAGGNTLFLTTANNYTGATVVTGGTLRVRDDGTLANTSSVTVNFGTLLLDNSNLSDNLNRLNDSAGITLNGGTLSLFGRAGALSSETVGVVTLGIGANTISAATGNNGGQYPPQTGILRVGGLVRDASTGSTLTFSQNYTNTSAGQMGTISGNQENIVINGYNSGMLTNNIMGAWAVANSGYFNTTSVEFASYIDGLGVGALSTTGYAGYTTTLTNPATPVTGTATSNVRVVTNNSTAVQIASGGLTVNTLNVGNVAPAGTTTTGTNVNLTFAAATDVLNLAGGGLIIQNITGTNAAGTASIGTSSVQGVITAGGAAPTSPVDLYLYYYTTTVANALTINSRIVDNAGQPLRVIYWGGNQGTSSGTPVVVLANDTNNYSGGTVVNQQQLDIGISGGAAGNLPGGGLIINNGTVRQMNGTISSQAVTLNGGSTLTLAGNNSLTSLTFNNIGGTSNPTVTTGGTLTLTASNAVTATSSNVAATSSLTGTLSLLGAAKTFNIGAIEIDGKVASQTSATLSVSAIIGGDSQIIKTGAGILQLSGANTFTGGVDLQAGGLRLASNNAALGTGTFTISGNNTVVSSDGRTIANAIALGSSATNITFGQYNEAATTYTGTVNWGSGVNRTIEVNTSPTANVQTFSGIISGSGTLTKTGNGILALTSNNNNTFDLSGSKAVQVLGGTLRIALDSSLGNAPTTFVSDNIVLNNGTLSASGNTTIHSNRGILLGSATGSGGGVFEVVTAGQTMEYSGVVADNGTGADSMFKTGNGTLYLGGNNTYSGTTNVYVGVLRAGSAGALGSTAGGTFVLSGATLELVNGISIGAESLSLSGTGVGGLGALRNMGGSNSYAGAVTLTSASSIRSASGALLLTGGVTGGGFALTTAGDVTFQLSGGSTMTNVASLELAGGALKMANTSASNNSDRVSNSMAVNVVNSGAISFTHDSAAGTNYSETLGVLTLSGGHTEITTSEAATGQTSTLTFANLVRSGTATVNFADFNLGDSTRNRVVFNAINGNSSFTGLIGGWATIGGAFAEYADIGGGNFSVRALSTAVATGESTWLDYTVNAAPIVGTDINLDNNPTSSAYRKLNTLALGGSTVLDVTGSGTNSLAVKTGIVSADADHIISVPFLKIGDGTVATTLPITVNSGTLTISGVVANNALNDTNFAGTLQKSGIGKLRLTNINSYTGGTLLSGGSLLVGNNFALGSGKLTMAGGVLASDGGETRTLLNAVDFTATGNFGEAGNTGNLILAGVINTGSDLRTITVNNGVTSLTGALTGTGGFVKDGAGTLSLTGNANSTFTGNIFVNQGFLALGSNGNSADSSGIGSTAARVITVQNGAGLLVFSNWNVTSVKSIVVGAGGAEFKVAGNSNFNVDDGNQISGSGNILKTGYGTFTLATTTYNYTSEITVAKGRLSIGGTNGLVLGAVGPNSGVKVLNGAEMVVTGASTISEYLTLNGTGDSAIGAQGAYGGSLVITAAAIFNGPITLASNSAIGVSSGVTSTINGAIGQSASGLALTKLNTGVLVLTGNNTYTGSTIVRGGTLRVSGAAGSIGSSSGLTVMSNGILELQNTAAANNGDRVSNSAAITMNGGTFSFNNTAAAAAYTETTGAVNVNRGANTVNSTQNTLGTSALTLSALARTGSGTVNFTGTSLGLDATNRILVTGQSAGFIGAWATVNGADFAKYDSVQGVTAMTGSDYVTSGNAGTWTGADHVKLEGVATVANAGITEISTLNMKPTGASGPVGSVSIAAGSTLRLRNGLLVSGTVASGGIYGGSLTAGTGTDGSGELLMNNSTAASNVFTIGASIVNNGLGAVAVTKSGAGTLVLAGTNTFTGALTVNQGLLGTWKSIVTDTIVVNGGALGAYGATKASTWGTANITMNGGAIQNFDSTGRTFTNNITINNDVTIGSANIGAGGGMVFTGSIALGSNTWNLNVANTFISSGPLLTSGMVVFSGPVTGTAGFVKSGAGVLLLSGNNSGLSGDITVAAGTLRVGSNAALGANGNRLVLNGGTFQATADLTIASDRKVIAGVSGGTITTNTDTTLTFGGLLEGANLTKNGLGTLVLSGNNTDFEGLMTISAGALRIQNSNALGLTGLGRDTATFGTAYISGGPITIVTSGAALELAGNISVGDESLVLSGTGIVNGGGLRNVSGNNTWSGQIFLNAASRINSDAGTLTLTQQIINAGTTGNNLTLGGAGNIVVQAAIATNLNSTGAGTAITGTTLTKDGSGTVTLQGANTYTGLTTVSNGVLRIEGGVGSISTSSGLTVTGGAVVQVANTFAATGVNRIGDAAALTFSGSGGFQFTNNGGLVNYSETLGQLVLTAGSAQIAATQAEVGQTSTLSFTNGLGTRGATATANFSGVGLGDSTRNRIVLTTAPTITNGIMGGWATVNGTDFATYDTTATAGSVRALQTYTTTAENTWAAANNVKVSADTTLTAGRTINSLNLTLAAATALNIGAGNTLAINSGGLLVTGTGAGSINGGTLTANTTGAASLFIHQYSTQALTIGSAIANNAGAGAVTLVKSGTGTLVLTGTNTYTGGTVLNEGVLRFDAAGAVTSNFGTTFTFNGGTLQLGIASLAVTNLASTNANAVINSSLLSGSTFSSINTDSAIGTVVSSTFAGLLQDGTGKLSFTKTTANTTTGGGTLILTNANSSYTGVTTVTGGGANSGSAFSTSVLSVTSLANIGQNSSIGRGDSTNAATNAASLVLDGGVLQYTGAGATTDRLLTLGATSVAFRANANGSSTLNVHSVTGGIDSSGATGALIFSNTGAIAFSGSGARQFMLTGSNTADNRFSSVIGDGVGGITELIKAGAGRWILDGANTYTGRTIIDAGTLVLASNTAAGTGDIILRQSGVVLEVGGLTIANKVISHATSPVTVLVTGDTTFTGAFTSGTAALDGQDVTVNVAAGQTATFTGGVDFTTRAHAISKIGNGTLTLVGNGVSGSNYVRLGYLYMGTSNVNAAGVLKFENVGDMTIGNDFRMGSGVLDISQMQTSAGPATLTVVMTGGQGLGTGAPNAATQTILLGGNTLAVNSSFYYQSSGTGLGATVGDVGAISGFVSLLNASRNFDINDSAGAAADVTINAGIIGTGTSAALVKRYAGTLVLAGDNTYTGSTTLRGGGLVLDYGLNAGTKLSSTAILGFGTLQINVNDYSAEIGTGSLILKGSNSVAVVEDVTGLQLGTGTADLVIAGSSTMLRAVTYQRNNNNSFSAPLTGVLTYDMSGGNGIFRFADSANTAVYAAGTTFAGLFVKDASGVLGFGVTDAAGNVSRLTGVNLTNLASWAAGNNIDLSAGPTGAIANDLVINSLRYDANAAANFSVAAGKTLGVTTGNIMVTSAAGASAVTIGTAGSILESENEARDLIFALNNTGTTTVAANIRSDQGVTKMGTGLLVLNGNNTFAGNLTIYEGGVQVTGGRAIGDSSVIVLANRVGAYLDVQANETIGGLVNGANSTAANTGVNIAANVTLRINSATTTNNQNWNGNVTGTGTLVYQSNSTGVLNFNGIATTFAGNLVVEGGQITFSSRNSSNVNLASSYFLNAGTMLLDFNSGTEGNSKIRDGAMVTLINTGGKDGLRANSDRNDSSKTETIGVLNLLGGANTITLQANAANGSAIRTMGIAANDIQRNNRSTLLVRGNNLGDISGSNLNSGRLTNAVTPTGNNFIGGGGAAGTKTISITPWIIGDNTATASTTHGAGNSFVTYAATTGYRALTTAEYETVYGSLAGAPTSNFAISATTTGLAAATANSLRIDTGTADVTMSGTGVLAITSGAIMQANVSGTSNLSGRIDGYTGITTGAANEYIVYVTNTGTLTIDSPFTTTTAAFTKSGAGTLILSSATGSTFTGAVTINQGVLQISAVNQIGTGTSLVMNGGTFKYGASFDLTSGGRVITLGVTDAPGIAYADYQTAGGTFDTNGNNVVFGNAVGGGGNGGLTKTGLGDITLNAANTYTGDTTILQGSLTYGINSALSSGGLVLNAATATLNLGAFNDTIGRINLINGIINGTGTLTTTFDTITVQAGTIRANLADTVGNPARLLKTTTGTVTLTSANSTYTGVTEIQAGTLVVTNLADRGNASSIGTGAYEDGAIRLGSAGNAGTLQYLGTANASTNRLFQLVGTGGAGIIDNASQYGASLTLSGNVQGMSDGDTLGAAATNKAFTLQGISTGNNVFSGSIMENNGIVRLNKDSAGIWSVTGVSYYTGSTTVTRGTLAFNSIGNIGAGAGSLGAATATSNSTLVLGSSANFAGLRYIGSANATTDRVVTFAGTTGNVALEVAGAGSLTYTSAFAATGAGAKTLYLRGSGDGVIAAAFNNLSTTSSNATTLIKNGGGTWTLKGNNGITGALTVNQGKLVLSDAGALASVSGITINGGTLELNNSVSNVANRLGGKGITLNGGTLSVLGGGSGALSEITGMLTVNSGQNVISVTAGGAGSGSNVFQIASGGTAYTLGAVGGTLLVTGNGLGSAPSDSTVNIKFGGTAPTFTNGIRAEMVGNDGTNVGFVTYDVTNGLRVLTGTDFTALPTQPLAPGFANVAAATSNARVASSELMTTGTSVNSLTMAGGSSLTSAGGNQPGTLFNALGALNTLTLTSGGIVAENGNSSINGGVITTAASFMYFHTFGNLNVSSYLTGATGTVGLVKADSGTLTLSAQSYLGGSVNVNAGTLVLNAGNNTLLVAQTATTATVRDLRLNSGLLNLSGNNQAVGALSSADTVAGTGGNITSSTAATFTTSTTSNTTYAGVISDAVTVTKAGSGNLTLTAAQTYAGATNVIGGTLTLIDQGSLASTSINIHYGTLALTDAGLNEVGISNKLNRIADNASISMRGGALNFSALSGLGAVERVGTVTLGEGANSMTAANSSSSTVFTIGNLVRSSNSGATINFVASGGALGANAQLQPWYFLEQINGVATTDMAFMGAWAIGTNTASTYDYMAYNTGTGVGVIGTTGFPTYANTLASGNITNLTSTTALGASNTTGALRLAGGSPINLTYSAATDLLVLESGGLLRSGAADTAIGTLALRGVLTAGTSATTSTELIAYIGQNTTTIHSLIKDTKDTSVGGAGVVTLVKSGAGGLTLTGANTHTGGTIVNQGTLTLTTNVAGTVVIPGDLTINGATVTMTAFEGQIASASNVTLNGSSVLTMVGTNTLASLTFNNRGGSGTTQVTTATKLILSAANAITVDNDNLATTPTIAGSSIELSNNNPVINVTGDSPMGLVISAPLNYTGTGGQITKTGDGSLVLSGSTAHILTGGLKVAAGTLILDNSAATNTYGTGVFTLEDETTIQAGTAVRTITNAFTVNGDFTFGGTANIQNLTLSGAMALSAGINHTITVGSPQVTATINGKVSGGTGFIKAGAGTLILGNSTNDYGGKTVVAGGLVKIGVAGAIPDGSELEVRNGGTFDMNNFDEKVRALSSESNTSGGLITNSGATAKTLTVDGGTDTTSTVFAGSITNGTGALNLVKTGQTTQVLAWANSYTGTTVVDRGGLQVGLGGNGSLNGTGAVTVGTASATLATANVATLSGSGRIAGATTIGSGSTVGILAPGDSAGGVNGRLEFGGALTISNGSQMQLQISSATTTDLNISTSYLTSVSTYETYVAGTIGGYAASPVNAANHDFIQVDGTLTIGSTAAGSVAILDNGYLTGGGRGGDVFLLLDWSGTMGGTFNTGANRYVSGGLAGDLLLPTLGADRMWDVGYLKDYGVLIVVGVVPEPGRMMLLLLGFLCLGFRRRRKAD